MKQQIEMLPIDELVPYAKNSRTHSPAQIKQIESSIREFGFTNPVLIDADGGIIAGHGRVMAAKNIGLSVVPCLRLSNLTDVQKRAYVIADNKLAENAGWNTEILHLELKELFDFGYDIDLLGFNRDELDALLQGLDLFGGKTDENDVPPIPEEPITRLGDVYYMGEHRLICGDSTDVNVVNRLLEGGKKPCLMVTDPPYGVNYDASWRQKILGKSSCATGKVLNDDRCDWREAWALFPGNIAYVWHGGVFAHVVAESLEACGFEIRSQIIWAKSQLVISRGHYHSQHEPCWYAVRKGATANWQGSRKKSTLWRNISEVLRDGEKVFVCREDAERLYAVSGDETTVWDIPKSLKSETGHSTQKPVECMRRPILNNSKVGDVVYDPFCGSGTTIIAAEQTGRVCYSIELNPAYVDVAVKRWEQFTGKTAKLVRGAT